VTLEIELLHCDYHPHFRS